MSGPSSPSTNRHSRLGVWAPSGLPAAFPAQPAPRATVSVASSAGSDQGQTLLCIPGLSRAAVRMSPAGAVFSSDNHAPLPRLLTNVVGFDDGPFDRRRRGDVLLVG